MVSPVGVQQVLIIEDDTTVAEVATHYLERGGYLVDSATDGADGLARALRNNPDLVVLDLMLPQLSGLQVFQKLRAASVVPVVMLTARSTAQDRIAGLELGADDYLTKPFSPQELVARVRAVLRRSAGQVGQPAVLRAGELEVDTAAHRLTVRGVPVSLTGREFDLLVHLMRHPHRAFRREELLADVWGYTFGDTSTITVCVRRLRVKIEREPDRPRQLRTVWGVGYRFEP